MELKPAHFEHFFCAIHGCSPFPWQQALVDRLAETDEWPDVLDLPTGTGKTATLDIAVFHLALRATTLGKAAIRMVLVVDRRLVVDDAYARAKKIESALANGAGATKTERLIIAEVAGSLGHLAERKERPLVARRLRGGVPLESEWARTPTQPTILCSTVDQVGSRLLFRGYGVSDRMKPVHAGLLGQDSLILLDEAHLSQPFWQTLSSLQKIGRAGIQAVLLSATPGFSPKNSFKLTSKDHRHQLLKKRLEASKPTRLYKPFKNQEELARALAKTSSDMANRLREAGVSAPAVGVVVNRVSLARETYNKLIKQRPESDILHILLMIGRSRSVVRDEIVDRQLKPFRTNSAERGAGPLFVVATQCLEVGVDLDLDGLVTQSAPIDALRQRFGRLNRAGRDIRAEGAILALKEDVASKADDPIYGNRIQTTWKELNELGKNGMVDFGIEQVETWKQSSTQNLAALVAPKPNAPVLMPAYLDLWSQTSPIPAADPDVNLFLHGVTNSSADVSLVWRSDLKEQDVKEQNAKALEELISLVPPRPGEILQVPLWTARAWLATDGSTSIESIADVPGKDNSSLIHSGKRRRLAFRWAGCGNQRTKVVGLSELSPGDVLVVPAEYGGCDRFGWVPESVDQVEDVADKAVFHQGYVVRVAPDGVRTNHQWKRLAAILAADMSAERDRIDRLIDAASLAEKEALDHGGQGQEQPIRDVRAGLEEIRKRAQGRITIHRYPEGLTAAGGAIFVAEKGLRGVSWACGASTENDLLSNSSSTIVLLNDHSQHVENWAKSFCSNLGLCADLAEDIALAAFLHDAGKADPRFQVMLCGGHAWNQFDNSVIAKSRRSWDKSAWRRAKLPKRWRHESLSVRMARVHPRFAKAHNPNLILWLIGTHHGFGRPFFNFADDETEINPRPCLGIESGWAAFGLGPESMAFDYDGIDWAGLFERLKEKYGIWRLAQFEAILRLADHRASEEGRGVQ